MLNKTQTKGYFNLANPGQTELNLINCSIKENGAFCRKGFNCDIKNPIYRSDFSLYTENELILTECYFFLNGEYGRVAIAVADNLSSNIIFNMKLIFLSGEVKEIGQIEFNRVSFDQFGRPDGFTVFSGKPTKGCGIYFICRQVYGEGFEDFVRVMELNANMDGWILLNESDIYAPVLLVNGRGERYYFATAHGESLKLPNPISYQTRNLLTGKFVSYYTTDGTSYGFLLPLENLDNTLIRCTLENDGETTVWEIPGSEENSSAITFNGDNVVVLCDRKKGRIYIKVVGGADYPFPYTGKLNNLKIEAYKTDEKGKIKVASMTCAQPVFGDVSKTEDRVSLFYGSYLYPSVLILNSPLNPLYFPEDASFSLGESQKKILKVIPKERNLLAFKESEVFATELRQFSGFNELNLNSEIKVAKNYYPLEFKKVADLSLAPIPDSIAKYKSDLVFTTRQGDLVRLTGTQTGIYKAERVGEIPKNTRGFGLSAGDDYFYFYSDRAVVLCEGVLSCWELPNEVFYGFSYLNEFVLFSYANEFGVNIFYPVWLEGELDKKVIETENGLLEKAQKVVATYSFNPFKTKEGNLRFLKVLLYGSCNDIKLSITENNRLKKFSRIGLNNSASLHCGFISKNPKVELEFSGGSIREIEFLYRALNKF